MWVRVYMVQQELEGYRYACERMERLVTDLAIDCFVKGPIV